MALSPLSCQQNVNNYKLVTLPSGKQVKVLSVGPVMYTSGSKDKTLMLSYQTDLKVSDKAALKKEVDEIWPALKEDAEKGGFTSAVIGANEVPHGWILKEGNSVNFVYVRSPDGKWSQEKGKE
jgi:hypothetical protein